MNIGDRIIGKKTGTLTPSTVVAIMTWGMYVNVILRDATPETVIEAWGKYYPDFTSKPIVISRFDEPQKNVSYQEYKKVVDSTDDEFTNAVRENPKLYNLLVKVRYSKIQEVFMVSYPEDDCEVLSESYSTQN